MDACLDHQNISPKIPWNNIPLADHWTIDWDWLSIDHRGNRRTDITNMPLFLVYSFHFSVILSISPWRPMAWIISCAYSDHPVCSCLFSILLVVSHIIREISQWHITSGVAVEGNVDASVDFPIPPCFSRWLCSRWRSHFIFPIAIVQFFILTYFWLYYLLIFLNPEKISFETVSSLDNTVHIQHAHQIYYVIIPIWHHNNSTSLWQIRTGFRVF